jgi:hypothetical protein
VSKILERLAGALDKRFSLPSADLKVGFVAGAPGADAMTLIRQAGAALAESKASSLRRP